MFEHFPDRLFDNKVNNQSVRDSRKNIGVDFPILKTKKKKNAN